MPVTNFTPLLGLALPTTGDLSGTWGTTVNTAITDLLDDAVAGTVTLSADADVTLTTTNGADNQARSAVILWTASNGATTRNITAPAQSKAYIVINAGTGSVVIRGSGPTTGVTVTSGYKALVAWNGSDFVKIASTLVNLASEVTGILPVANGGTATATPSLVQGSNITITGTWPNQTIAAAAPGSGTVTSVAATVPSLLSVSGSPITSSGTLAFTYSGTALPVANGGTSLTTLTANNVILGNGTSAPTFVAPSTSGNVLTSNGTTWASTAPAAPGLGTVTSVAATVPSIFSIAGSPITTNGTLAMTYSGTALPVANGGTSLTTLTANNVILGNGASAPTFVAPSTSGNVLTSNGTTWASSTPATGASGANPTATVSGSVVNGVAVTFMRSDGAPALANTAVTAAAYTYASLTVDAQGRLTAASSGTTPALLSATQTFTGGQIGAVTALTSSASAIAINLATNNNFSYTTTQNSTLAAPSNPVAGQSGVITITQGATARTLAYNTFYKFAGGTVPTLTATASAVDTFAYYVESATRATCQLIKDVK